MRLHQFVKRSRIDAPAEDVFRWHARPGAFERLSPPWERTRVIERSGGIEPGGRVVIEMRVGPTRRRWVAVHTKYKPGRMFKDIQREGPFAKWEHTHLMEPTDEAAGCWLEDRIEYALPFGAVGDLVAANFVRKKLEAVFEYRHRVTRLDIESHRHWQGGRAMRILVTGSHGLIGRALVPFLRSGGHEVSRLVREAPKDADEIFWDPAAGKIDKERLEGFDIVIHLAGEGIAEGRWTARKKARIRNSRVDATRLLAEALAGLNRPPRAFLCASAVGYYGNRGDEALDETSASGEGFLAEVCKDWEAAARPANERSIRVAYLRFGAVLSPLGGALAKMLFPFLTGGGAPLGDGRQWISWIALDDALDAILRAAHDETMSGPVNIVAPNPVTNLGFAQTLARTLRRPLLLSIPAFGARMIFGEMADEVLLASQRVIPARLLSAGHLFRHTELGEALGAMLGKSPGIGLAPRAGGRAA